MRLNGGHTAPQNSTRDDNSQQRQELAVNTTSPNPDSDRPRRQFGSWPPMRRQYSARRADVTGASRQCCHIRARRSTKWRCGFNTDTALVMAQTARRPAGKCVCSTPVGFAMPIPGISWRQTGPGPEFDQRFDGHASAVMSWVRERWGAVRQPI